MIVVVGRVKSDADRRAQLIALGTALSQASREEVGCLTHCLYESAESPDEFVFVEEWVSIEALRQHFATPHVAEFMGAVSGVLVDTPDVRVHEVSNSMGLAEAASA